MALIAFCVLATGCQSGLTHPLAQAIVPDELPSTSHDTVRVEASLGELIQAVSFKEEAPSKEDDDLDLDEFVEEVDDQEFEEKLEEDAKDGGEKEPRDDSTAQEHPFDSNALSDLLSEESPDVTRHDDELRFPGSPNGARSGSFDMPLTMEEAESLTSATHPELVAARSEVDAAWGQYVQSGLQYNPTLQYQSDEIGNEDASGIHSVSLSQQFVTANKLGIAQQVQAQEVQKRQAMVELARLRVVTRMRTRFITALVAQKRLTLAQQIARLSQKSLESVEDLWEAEEVSKIALLQAKVELQRAKMAQDNVQTELDSARRDLAAAIGIPELRRADLSGEVQGVFVETPWQTMMNELTAKSPELAAAGAQVERAKWALSLACAQATPNITGQVGVGYDAVTDDTFARIGISIPLPIHNRNQGAIRTARAKIHQAQAAVQQTQLDLASRLAKTIGQYKKSLQQLRRLEDEILPIAEETYELSREAFDAGESDYLQLLTAQRTLFTTRVTLLDASASARLAAARVEGLLVERLQN